MFNTWNIILLYITCWWHQKLDLQLMYYVRTTQPVWTFVHIKSLVTDLFMVGLQAVLDNKQHSVSYTLNRSQAVVVEYTLDEDTDMFQVH